MAYDLLIKNGRVVDGTGGPSYYADVAIQNGKIVGVGRFNESAARVINADGRVVAPGFIDHHTHYDPQALYDPLCSSTAQNGNTTVIVGQCGQVLAPARPGDHDWYMEFFSDREDVPLAAMRNGIDFSWESIAGYMDALGRKRGVNAGILIGHSGVRRYVMGEEASHRAESTPEEIEAMRALVRDGILAGALASAPAREIPPPAESPPIRRGSPWLASWANWAPGFSRLPAAPTAGSTDRWSCPGTYPSRPAVPPCTT